jgi:nifR3 family TIM-barrel protein
MLNFWQKLKKDKKGKPILVIAPMADVTDIAFRKMFVKYGKPDVMWTEFVSADGLCLAPQEGKNRLLKDLFYTKSEKPIIAQFFTSNPEHMFEVAKLAQKMKFDGIDINMGCPDKSIEKQGAGASLMKNPKLAQKIILSAKSGAGDLPISVKTRIGFNKPELETWLPAILETNPALVTIHARTRKQLSKVNADWSFVKRAVEIRNEMKSKTLIFGNGDIFSLEDAYEKAKETGCDGIMIGRGIFGNPWFFTSLNKTKSRKEIKINLNKKLKALIEHTKLFEKYLIGYKNFSVMKKHFKAYIEGFDGAKELRALAMETNSAKELENIIRKWLKK